MFKATVMSSQDNYETRLEMRCYPEDTDNNLLIRAAKLLGIADDEAYVIVSTDNTKIAGKVFREVTYRVD